MSHRFPPYTGGGLTGVSPPNPSVPGARRTIKMNNIAAYLGNSAQENAHLQDCLDWHANHIQFYGLGNIMGNPSDEAQLAAFIAKARNTYGIVYVGGIRASQNGFQEMYDYNLSRSNPIEMFDDFNIENEFWFGERVTFTVPSTVNTGTTYGITLNGHAYNHVRAGGETAADVADAIYALIPQSGTPPSVWTKSQPSSRTIDIWADDVAVPYTYSDTNLSSSVINLTRDQWMDMGEWLKALLVSGGQGWLTSAYVQNYTGSPRWGATQAARMIQFIDVYESTNYIPDPGNPDPDRSIESQLYLLANALAANPGVKPKQAFQVIISAEYDYSHTSLDNNGMFDYETDWQNDYNAYGTSSPYGNAAFMEFLGTNYFSYNHLKLAPAIVF